MRPLPASLMIALLLGMCGLCSWQWHRENLLRHIAVTQRDEASRLAVLKGELEGRVKTADGEILRLTGSFNELRNNSVSKQVHEELLGINMMMRETIEKQNAAIKEQNEALMKQSQAIQQANESIKKVAAERDGLAKKVNEVTGRYNKLVKASGQGEKSAE